MPASPAILKTGQLDMSTLKYVGVVELPRVDGSTVQVLKFTMQSAVQVPFELDVPAERNSLDVITASKLTISGDVEFYCTRFAGWLVQVGSTDLIKLTFTPDAPPPLVLDKMTFHDAQISLVYVHANKLVAEKFRSLNQ